MTTNTFRQAVCSWMLFVSLLSKCCVRKQSWYLSILTATLEAVVLQSLGNVVALRGKTLSWASTVEELHSTAAHWNKINPVQPPGSTSEGQGTLRVCSSCVCKTNQTTKPSPKPTENKQPSSPQQGDYFSPPVQQYPGRMERPFFTDRWILWPLGCPCGGFSNSSLFSRRILGSWTHHDF